MKYAVTKTDNEIHLSRENVDRATYVIFVPNELISDQKALMEYIHERMSFNGPK